MKEPIISAYAWASGLIEFTTPKRRRCVPSGALQIAKGPRKKLRLIVSALAREGMGASAGKLLVPGIPEADLIGNDPVDCLIDFSRRVKGGLSR